MPSIYWIPTPEELVTLVAQSNTYLAQQKEIDDERNARNAHFEEIDRENVQKQAEWRRREHLKALRRHLQHIEPTPPLAERLARFKVARAAEARRKEFKSLREAHRAERRGLRAGRWPDRKLRRSNIKWDEIIPKALVPRQKCWERATTAAAMRRAHVPLSRISEAFGMFMTELPELFAEATRVSPVEIWQKNQTTTKGLLQTRHVVRDRVQPTVANCLQGIVVSRPVMNRLWDGSIA